MEGVYLIAKNLNFYPYPRETCLAACLNFERLEHFFLLVKCSLQSTEGWECNLGLGGAEIFFANNGLGGFLGPRWKVFNHGTLRKHFQEVVKVSQSLKNGLKWGKK